MSFNKIEKLKNSMLTIGNLPTSYKDSLSYPEQLQVLKHALNQVIENYELIINSLEDLENNYSIITQTLDDLQLQINNINSYFESFRTEILNSVDSKNNELYNRVIVLLNDYQTIFNNSISNLRNDLESEIERIELGDIKAYNPTTGEFENVSKVIMDIYETLRQNAISCIEFDSLELSASEFDSKEITAYNFDVNGKLMLLNV